MRRFILNHNDDECYLLIELAGRMLREEGAEDDGTERGG